MLEGVGILATVRARSRSGLIDNNGEIFMNRLRFISESRVEESREESKSFAICARARLDETLYISRYAYINYPRTLTASIMDPFLTA